MGRIIAFQLSISHCKSDYGSPSAYERIFRCCTNNEVDVECTVSGLWLLHHGGIGIVVRDAGFPLHDGLQAVLEVVADVLFLGGADDDPGGVGEEVVHLLERAAGRLGQQEPEEEGVGGVADDEEEVVLVSDVLHRDGGDLALLDVLVSFDARTGD